MIDLNDVATSTPRHDLAAVRDRLAITANDWLPRLFPEAQLARDRRALRCADLSGRAPRKDGSCTIHLDGPYAGLGFDYATGDDDDWTMACRCGAAACRDTITGQDWRKPAIRRLRAGQFAYYLERRIRAGEA